MIKIIDTTENSIVSKGAQPFKSYYYMGNIDALCNPICAVIGTRQATDPFIKLTKAFVNKLNEYNIGCLSGGAFGIDIESHKHWLDTYQDSNPKPVLVLPRIQDFYPRSHKEIYHKLLDKGGLIVSQNKDCEDNKLIPALIQRDMVQASLSDMVCPIEMGIDSGTWYCINHAYKQNKPIIVLEVGLPMPKGIEMLINFPTENCKGFRKLALSKGDLWNQNIHLLNKTNIREGLRILGGIKTPWV
jgi:predicted Rossmann fold nucleotide-binding protein DprA/Smf involved in DNA uptake